MSILDRRDGKRVKGLHGMTNILIDFAPTRAESEVYSNVEIDVTNFCEYIDKLKKKYPHLTYFHGICYILGRTLYARPRLNYFVANRTMYEHKEKSISFVAKTEFKDEAVELMTVVPFKEDDTLLDVSDFISEKVKKMRSKDCKGDSADGAADFLGKLPKFLRVPIVGFLKWLDKHGWLPKSLMDGNLYYASGVVTDIGVFKTNAIYHHLMEFGTNSFIISFGEIYEKDGRKYMTMGAVIDERVADGFYIIKALKLIEYMYRNPKVMIEKMSEHITVPKEER